MSRLALVPLAPVLLLLASLVPAIAEKPRSSPAQLASTATHIVRGEVVRVYSRVRREGMFRRTDYVAEVTVKAVEKGEGIRLDRPLCARYWSRTWTGPGYPPPGTNGHDPLPEEGEAVRIGLDRVRSNGYVFQVEMAYLTEKLGYRFLELPIYFEDRRIGHSKMTVPVKVEAALRTWQLRWRHRNARRIENQPATGGDPAAS